MEVFASAWEGRASRELHRSAGARVPLSVLSRSREWGKIAAAKRVEGWKGSGAARRTRARADVCSFVAEPGARADAWNMLELDLEEGQNY